MASPSPILAPPHVLAILSKLHKLSLDQEALLNTTSGKFTSTDTNTAGSTQPQFSSTSDAIPSSQRPDFDALMLDKFIALDEGKCQFMYNLILAIGATNVVEAGTSFGVSTIYLALAVGRNMLMLEKEGSVIGTEKEREKAEVARGHWRECGEEVESVIDLRVGDLLETLKTDLPDVDLLLLDIWTPLALPTLRLVQPKLRHGAVVLADNTISGAAGYKDLLDYMRAPGSEFSNITLPYTNGFEMSVYVPLRKPQDPNKDNEKFSV